MNVINLLHNDYNFVKLLVNCNITKKCSFFLRYVQDYKRYLSVRDIPSTFYMQHLRARSCHIIYYAEIKTDLHEVKLHETPCVHYNQNIPRFKITAN